MNDVGPNRLQRRPERTIAGFHEQISRPGVKVVGPNGVAQRICLLLERNSILIVVATAGDLAAQCEDRLRQLQITRLARHAIQLHQAHVVGGTDRTARRFGRGAAECRVEKVRRLAGYGEQVCPAGDTIMDARRGHQVAQVIHLEVVPVLKRQRVGVAVARADQHGRVEVTVRALGFGDDTNDVVEALVEFLVLCD